MKEQYISQETLNQANQFVRLKVNLSRLVELSRVPANVKINGSGMAGRAHFYRKLKARNFNADQLIGILNAIVEYENNEFEELQTGLSELIELSKVPEKEKLKGAEVNSKNFYKRLSKRNFNTKQLINIFRSIVEYSNIIAIKNRTQSI